MQVHVPKRRRPKKPFGRTALEAAEQLHLPDSTARYPTQSAPSKRVAQANHGPRRDVERLLPITALRTHPRVLLWTILLIAVLVLACWPTFVWLESNWRNELDYSHGYIVIGLSVLLLWMRRHRFPGIRSSLDWRGLWLIATGVAMQVTGRLAEANSLCGWSLAVLVAGIIWLRFGLLSLRWAAPAIAILVMMVPLPDQAGSLLGSKLQEMATKISTTLLLILGEPAIAEGNTIWVGETQLMIEEFCTGLRIFAGAMTLAFFWAATVQRNWLDCLVIVAAAVPLAMLTNALQITAVGCLYAWADAAEMKETIHRWAALLSVPLAGAVLWLVKAYWERLYRPIEVYNLAERLHAEPSP